MLQEAAWAGRQDTRGLRTTDRADPQRNVARDMGRPSTALRQRRRKRTGSTVSPSFPLPALPAASTGCRILDAGSRKPCVMKYYNDVTVLPAKAHSPRPQPAVTVHGPARRACHQAMIQFLGRWMGRAGGKAETLLVKIVNSNATPGLHKTKRPTTVGVQKPKNLTMRGLSWVTSSLHKHTGKY